MSRGQRVWGQGGDMSVLQSAISRRRLLGGGLAGGFLLAFHLPTYGASEPAPGGTKGKFAPNAFIRIGPAGRTTLVMPQVEMGQGVYTSVAMILAEELDADYQQVVLEHAPPDDKLYGNPVFGIQVTGNSNSIRAFWKPLREAGAAARAMLIQAAAQQWKVDPASCTAADGQVRHIGSGRKAGFGTLAGAASKLAPPKNPPRRSGRTWARRAREVGRSRRTREMSKRRSARARSTRPRTSCPSSPTPRWSR